MCVDFFNYVFNFIVYADDVLVRMMDDRTAESCRTFLGHNGPIYRCSFSPDRSMVLSCSEDTTIRLWSLQTMTCVVSKRLQLKWLFLIFFFFCAIIRSCIRVTSFPFGTSDFHRTDTILRHARTTKPLVFGRQTRISRFAYFWDTFLTLM